MKIYIAFSITLCKYMCKDTCKTHLVTNEGIPMFNNAQEIREELFYEEILGNAYRYFNSFSLYTSLHHFHKC